MRLEKIKDAASMLTTLVVELLSLIKRARVFSLSAILVARVMCAHRMNLQGKKRKTTAHTYIHR